MTNRLDTTSQDNTDVEDDNSELILRLHVKVLEKPEVRCKC